MPEPGFKIKVGSPDHDDDEQEEEDLILSHVELAGLVAVVAEQGGADGVDQLAEDEGQTEDEVDPVVGLRELLQLFG